MSTTIAGIPVVTTGSGTGSQSGVDPNIKSWAQLAAVVTVGLAVGTLKVWKNDADGAHKVTELRAGTDATDTANGIQRPADYADPANAKVWYQV